MRTLQVMTLLPVRFLKSGLKRSASLLIPKRKRVDARVVVKSVVVVVGILRVVAVVRTAFSRRVSSLIQRFLKRQSEEVVSRMITRLLPLGAGGVIGVMRLLSG
jgi:uncharacterized protein YbjQ (UPF0145 family)